MAKISEIQIIPIKPNNGLVGFASFVFDNCFYFSSIGIYTRPQGGYRLTYPTRKTPNGSLQVFNPINREVANAIELAVISKYEDVTNKYDRHNCYDAK
jgi:stage V sporulation protein G